MILEPFLLDHWLDQVHTRSAHVEFDLGASTGPKWTLRKLLDLVDTQERESWIDLPVSYSAAQGQEGLREALASFEGVSPEEIQIVTGASEGLWILLFFAAGPGANVVLPHPCFPAIGAIARALGLEVRTYPLHPERRFRLDVDDVRRQMDPATRLVLVVRPGNPAGEVVEASTFRALHELCADRGVPLVCDQVYHPIYHDGPEPATAASLPGVIVLGDLSKALSLSGLRVGWIADTDPERRRRYLDARSYFTATNSPITERLATFAVRHRDTILGHARRVAQVNLRLLDAFMQDHGDRLGWVAPRGGFTAFPWLREDVDARPFCAALLDQGVLAVPGDCFGMPRHIRIGFGAEGDRFPDALAIVDRALRLWTAGTAPTRPR